MKKFLLKSLLLLPLLAFAVTPELQIFELNGGKYRQIARQTLGSNRSFSAKNVNFKVTKITKKGLDEYAISAKNNGRDIIRLKYRIAMPLPGRGGDFWDGFEFHKALDKDFANTRELYVFPLAVYLKGGRIFFTGLAPQTISARFDNGIDFKRGNGELFFQHYNALYPGENGKFSLISGSGEARWYAEAVDKVHRNYPEFFSPVKGHDPRIYGVGGYFFSGPESRMQQLEEARRFGLHWEWYYNCYQRAGDIWPSPQFWSNAMGYKKEIAHAACDTPGTIEQWFQANKLRIDSGMRTTGMFYYYLQQYCNSDIRAKHYPNDRWLKKGGKPGYRAFGWAEEGWADYSWCGRGGKYAADMRADLAQVWKNLGVAGFALDCALGNTKYYGPHVKNEIERAFDDDGELFAIEGAALAYNMTYTRNLPPRNGRRATSIINENYTYLPAYYADSAIHEMPPFERIDVLTPRRMMLGYKPMYFWKGFRIDTYLDWERLSPDEIHEGLSGIVSYTIGASLRFGGIPAVFYELGFYDMIKWRPVLVDLLRKGWRAAPCAEVAGIYEADPFSAKAPYWISRYGHGSEAEIVITSTKKSKRTVELVIYTGKFDASGMVYAFADGTPAYNTVYKDRTVVRVPLADHKPMILQPVAVQKPGSKGNAVMVSVPGKGKQYLWNAKLCRYIPAPVKFEPEAIAALRPGTAVKTDAAIVAAMPEFKAVDPGADQLKVYFEYYFTRRIRPYHRLHYIGKVWKKDLRMKHFAVGEAGKVSEKVIFAIGSAARKALLPGVAAQDEVIIRQRGSQTVVGFFPGKCSENEVIQAFLGELDKSYPHFGGMVDSWTTKAKLFGRVFYLDKDKMARPAKRAVKVPAKAVKPVKTVKPAKPVVKNPPLAVIMQDKSLYLRHAFNEQYDLSLRLNYGVNGQLDFGLVRLVNKVIPFNFDSLQAGIPLHACADESAPPRINDTIIGGNHGAAIGVRVSAEAHGFTAKDLGKLMTAEKGRKYYLWQVINPDTIVVISENLSKGGDFWKFDRFSIKKQLKTVDNKIIPVQKWALEQIYPAVHSLEHTILLDGKPLRPGVVNYGSKLEISESYGIIASDDLMAHFLAEKNKNVVPKPFVTLENKFTFFPDGNCVVNVRQSFQRPVKLDYIGGVQCQTLAAPVGRDVRYFMPGTKAFEIAGEKFDFSVPAAMPVRLKADLNFGIKYGNIADPGNLPDKMVQFAGVRAKDFKADSAFAIGYIPGEAMTTAAARKGYVARPCFISRSKKYYPYIIDYGFNRFIKAGTVLEFNCYRNYFVPGRISTKAAAAYIVDDGKQVLLFVDYAGFTGVDTLTLPAKYNACRTTAIAGRGECVLRDSKVANGKLALEVKTGKSSAVIRLSR